MAWAHPARPRSGVLVVVLVLVPLTAGPGGLVGGTGVPARAADRSWTRPGSDQHLAPRGRRHPDRRPVGSSHRAGAGPADVPGRDGWRLALVLPVLVPDFVLATAGPRPTGPAGSPSPARSALARSQLGSRGMGGADRRRRAADLPAGGRRSGHPGRAQSGRAARACGARPATVLWTVTLPLLRPAIAAATVLCFVLTLQAFAIPQVMGAPAGFRTVTTEIYADLSFGSDPRSFVDAFALALLLVLVTLLVVGPADVCSGLGCGCGVRPSPSPPDGPHQQPGRGSRGIGPCRLPLVWCAAALVAC